MADNKSWEQKIQQGGWPSFHRVEAGYQIDIIPDPASRQYEVRIEGVELPFKWFTMAGMAKAAALAWVNREA